MIGRGQPEGGIAAAARKLGIDTDEGHRAVKVAALSPEAKQTARDLHLTRARERRPALRRPFVDYPDMVGGVLEAPQRFAASA